VSLDWRQGMTNGSRIGMTAARKVKVSVSLDAALVDAVDRRAAREGTTRSAVMEQWLTRASRQAALARLEEETAAYYDGLGASDKDDDSSWAKAASRSSRRLQIDAQTGPPARRARRS
jgi:hypothetical protein